MKENKYEKLTAALAKAKLAAISAVAENPEDGGTCNFDSPYIVLNRWPESRVKEAAEKAGCGCFKWGGYRKETIYVFPVRVGGQGNSRTRAAEAAWKSLKADGYRAGVYCQMD